MISRWSQIWFPVVMTSAPTPTAPSGGGGSYQTVNIASGGGPTASAAALKVETALAPAPITEIASVADMQAVLMQSGHVALASHIYLYVHPVKLEEGRFEFRPEPEAPQNLAHDLTIALKAATGKRWMVTVSTAPGEMTMSQSAKAAKEARFDKMRASPLVKQVFDIFPDAELKAIHKKEDIQ
jgi:DNA polymerase-3 subunit gamma/tau